MTTTGPFFISTNSMMYEATVAIERTPSVAEIIYQGSLSMAEFVTAALNEHAKKNQPPVG